MNLKPDYSWVPSELGQFIGGIQAICIILMIIATVAGVARFVFAKVTATKIDDAIGDRILVAVIIGCFFISGLGQLVGHEMKVWDVSTVSTTNVAGKAAEFKITDPHESTTQESRQAQDSYKKAGEAITKGDMGEAMKNLWEGLKHTGKTLWDTPGNFFDDTTKHGLIEAWNNMMNRFSGKGN
ncbi:hypothetical protein [Alloscardovia theropitheci]|uniref:hypothetical protein n=1 Tax=Alloscardovia theropitheci TaxID=2496842 RepID=UPI00196B1A30|nr:hypothetical protein [Alloscardovia theropitheci]